MNLLNGWWNWVEQGTHRVWDTKGYISQGDLDEEKPGFEDWIIAQSSHKCYVASSTVWFSIEARER